MYEITPIGSGIVIKKSIEPLDITEFTELINKLKAYKVFFDANEIREFATSKGEKSILLERAEITLNVSLSKLEAEIEVLGEMPSYRTVINFLRQNKVTYGILEDVIREAIENGLRKFRAASGKPPIPGRNGELKLFFEINKRKFKELSSGKIDFYNLDLFTFVKKDSPIAEVIPPTDGEDGIDIFGNPIKAQPGQKAVYTVGENAYTDGKFIRAKTDGVVIYEDGKFDVSPVLIIPTNVDINTGNINSEVDVIVKGWVRAGFKVISKKGIQVDGGVEQNTLLKAENNISVKLGIFGGGNAIVETQKNLYAKFVQDATLKVGGDIFVNEYIMNCNVTCEGNLFINGQKGKLINSQVQLRYSAHIKEIVGGKKTIQVTGFDRKELMEMFTKLMLERNKMTKLMSDLSLELKKVVLELKSGNLEGEVLKEAWNKQNKLANYYKSLLEQLGKVDTRLEELKELLENVKGEGSIYIREKANNLIVKIKEEIVKVDEIRNSLIYYDPDSKGVKIE